MDVPIRRRLRSGRRRDLSALVITSLVRAASGHPVIPGLAPSRSFPASLLPSRRMPGSRAGFSSFGVARRPRCDRPHPTVISAGAGILAVVFGGPSSCPPEWGPPDSTPGRPGECRDLPADDLSVIPANVGISAAATLPSPRRVRGLRLGRLSSSRRILGLWPSTLRSSRRMPGSLRLVRLASSGGCRDLRTSRPGYPQYKEH